jgi:hypothetical protein
LRRRDGLDNVNNEKYKTNQNCQYELPLYDEYITIKNLSKNKKKERQFEAVLFARC